MSLATPLYLAQVTADRQSCSLYTLGPLWCHFMTNLVMPFEVKFKLRPAANTCDWQLKGSTFEIVSDRGDHCRWLIDLGAPILQWSTNETESDERSRFLASVLKQRIDFDRANILRYQQGVNFLQGLFSWRTNSHERGEAFVGQGWERNADGKVKRLCETLQPAVVNLGLHLQEHREAGADDFIPVLEWFDTRGYLGNIGKGLLANLKRARALGDS